MAQTKIILLWQQACYVLIRTPVLTLLFMILLFMRRFYYTCFTSLSGLVYAAYALCIAYAHDTLFGKAALFFLFSLLMYLMRPTVGLKKNNYLRNYFVLESFIPTGVLVLGYLALELVLSTRMSSVVYIPALCSFAWLYDAHGCVPDKIGRALLRTWAFCLYNAPLIIPLIFCCMLVNYPDLGYLGMLLQLGVVYPACAALVTVLYVTVIHENYELYYAE